MTDVRPTKRLCQLLLLQHHTVHTDLASPFSSSCFCFCIPMCSLCISSSILHRSLYLHTYIHSSNTKRSTQTCLAHSRSPPPASAFLCVPLPKHLDMFKGAPFRLPKPLSDQLPVCVCSCRLCINRICIASSTLPRSPAYDAFVDIVCRHLDDPAPKRSFSLRLGPLSTVLVRHGRRPLRALRLKKKMGLRIASLSLSLSPSLSPLTIPVRRGRRMLCALRLKKNDVRVNLSLSLSCSRRREHLRAIAIQIAAVTAFSEA